MSGEHEPFGESYPASEIGRLVDMHSFAVVGALVTEYRRHGVDPTQKDITVASSSMMKEKKNEKRSSGALWFHQQRFQRQTRGCASTLAHSEPFLSRSHSLYTSRYATD